VPPAGSGGGTIGGGGCLDGTIVTTSYFDNGGGSWTIEVCMDSGPAGCDMSHFVLSVPVTAATITVSGCAAGDEYALGPCGFALGDDYKIDIDQSGACSASLRCVSITVDGVSGVDPTGGTMGFKGGQDCQTLSGLPAFIP
jgi:hypothetical protein